MEIDPKTGLPVEAIAWEDLSRGEQRVQVTTAKKKFGKIVTIVSGFDKGTDLKKIAKELKEELGCGGTVKNDAIELQGDHRRKIKPILEKLGFSESTISN
ncbi:stress response translation initiation inhibitor YciH [Candidatus Pacearchaeota archaeon]|nr:stress response translation initiation inhibitor YciH [Candidatus Pacearchaeota archaeon]